MKKIAIIGASSSILKNGWGQMLKAKFPNECDIFSIGGTTIQWAVFALLKHQIINNYKYVIFQFGPNDNLHVSVYRSHILYVISFLVWIITRFNNSISIPIFVSQTFARHSAIVQAFHWPLKALTDLCNIPVIDFQDTFKYISTPDLLSEDGGHFKKKYYNYIVDQIIEIMSSQIKIGIPFSNRVNFELFIPDKCGLKSHIDGTSLIKDTVYELTDSQFIILPENRYLCGVTYWIKDEPPFLIYENSYIRMSKSLDFNNNRNLFYSRQIGYTAYNGLMGGHLTVGRTAEFTFLEPGVSGGTDNISTAPIAYINSFLLSDKPIISVYEDFYWQYWESFNSSKLYSDSIEYMRHGGEIFQFKKVIQDLSPECVDAFGNILNDRPDLGSFLDSAPYPGERLLLWGWISGLKEYDFLVPLKASLNKGIRKLFLKTHVDSNGNRYPFLFLIISLTRPDLEACSLATTEGLKMFINWFESYGKYEYGLEA